MVISLFILCFASTFAFSSTNKEKRLEALSDSISNKIGQKDFMPFYQEYMSLARQQNDTVNIDNAYSQIASHYYRLRNTDSLKVVAYEYMDWCLKCGHVNNRYTQWRQYIQLLTEKGLQDEAMRETELLQKDADAAKSAFGMACGEMCIGYNHRMFSNNVKLCLEYYSSALKHFVEAGFYEDAYVVSLNIIQTNLARGEYANAIEYLGRMPGLIEKMKRKNMPVRPELTMRYYQFQVIATLALKGKKAAEPFIAQADKFYHENMNTFPREGWLGYKILCARTLNDHKMALTYLDSLMDYHHSVGSCYPANHLLKAQFMEQMGRFEDACEVYKSYAHINDSIRSAELDEQLSKYTVQFEVDKLEHDKLELRAEVNRNLFITSLIVGGLILALLLVITFYYMRYYQFQVIATLALKGKKAAEPFIAQADKFYHENMNTFPREGWLGYKILCARTLNDHKMALTYLDSLMDYHHSVGSCYPANHLLKAQFMEQMGRFEDACEVYKSYAHINDSIRSAELDEQLSKYTVQFEVDKLEHDKLELRAEVNRNLFITSLIVGGLILALLLVITFYYMRSLSLNRKLDAANKAVVKASHMKSSFIQHITHEIRTPLNSIIGFSSLMAAGGLTQEEIEEYARQMESSNAYLLDLVNNVIDIADMDSQTDDMPKKQVNVDACCRECMEAVRQNLKDGIELQYAPSSALVTLCTVEVWIKRVLLGLLNNANKFTESGFIRLSYAEDKPNHLVRFIIEDSGPGIDENYRDAIFERFAKIDAFTQGTGLGLSIIRQIMELVDGNVRLDTSYAGGARFVVEWPQ